MISIFKRHFNIEIDVFKVIYFITIYYSIYFFGAYPSDFEFNLINVSLLVLPSLILYGFDKTLEIKMVKTNLSIDSILIAFFSFLIFTFFYFYSPNLSTDEIYYAHKSIRFPLEIIKVINLKFNIAISNYEYYVRLISFSFLLISLLVIRSKYFYKLLKLNLFLIIFLRIFFWIFTGGIPLIHPPLSSLFSSILVIPFGINDILFKISTCLFFFIANTLVFNYLKFSLRNQIIFYAFLILFPIIGNNLVIHEQSVYYSIFLFFIIVLIDKIPISQISILIGISILFRQSSIVLSVIPFILTILNWKSFSQSFNNLYGILIGFPIFLKSLLIGTPSSPNSSLLINKLYNLNFDLIDFLDFKYLFFVITLLIIVLLRKEYQKIFFLITASFLYILIFKITRMSFGNKYIFEFYGSFLLLLIYFISKIENIRLVALLFLLILTVNVNFKDQYIYKNNSFSEILKTLGNNSSNTIFIRGDYYNFAHIIKSNSLDDYNEKFRFDIKYRNYLLEINETSNDGSFNLKHLLNYYSLPDYIVFMESSFNKLSEDEKNEIFRFFKIDFFKKETFKTYEYLILSLK